MSDHERKIDEESFPRVDSALERIRYRESKQRMFGALIAMIDLMGAKTRDTGESRREVCLETRRCLDAIVHERVRDTADTFSDAEKIDYEYGEAVLTFVMLYI